MDLLEKFPIQLLKIVLTKGSHPKALKEINHLFDTLELLFKANPSTYLQGSEVPQMVDFFAFPHISRVYYLKDS
jgi:hypothetical protein